MRICLRLFCCQIRVEMWKLWSYHVHPGVFAKLLMWRWMKSFSLTLYFMHKTRSLSLGTLMSHPETFELFTNDLRCFLPTYLLLEGRVQNDVINFNSCIMLNYSFSSDHDTKQKGKENLPTPQKYVYIFHFFTFPMSENNDTEKIVLKMET